MGLLKSAAAIVPLAFALSACESLGNQPVSETSRSEVARDQVERDFEYPLYRRETLVDEAENAFGQTSAEIAEVIDTIFDRQGRPQAFIAGEEVGGAIGIGVTYGAGQLYRPGQDPIDVYWQGPSLGFDFGGDASKVFIMVYDLGKTENIYNRFPGGGGNIFFVGGVGAEAMTQNGVTIVPVRTGVGARAGVSVEYMKITDKRDINPF